MTFSQSPVENQNVGKVAEPDIQCWSCGAERALEPAVSARGLNAGDGICDVYECRFCGHGMSHPPIKDVASLYQGRETQDYQAADRGLVQTIKRWAFRKQALTLLQQSSFESGRIIDFGCGSGLLTEALANARRANHEVVAMDFFESPPASLHRASYLPFSKIEHCKNSANLVTCMHVVEHDNDPVALLQTIKTMMKKDAKLIIEVPNVRCRWRSVFGRYWANWYLPFHRHHFSHQSLKSTLDKAGFDVEVMFGVHTPAMGRSLADALGQRNGLPFVLLTAALSPIQKLGERLTGEPSALRAVASPSSLIT